MAIRMMTVKEKANQPNVETVSDYPGCEVTRISHHWDCKHKSDPAFYKDKGPECCDRCSHYDPLYIETTHKGCVLDMYERNGYDDSDFYAIVWDEANQKIEHVQYATTRGWTYCNGASIDATPEVIAKAEAYQRQLCLNKWHDDNKKQADMPYKGRMVRVTKGRKIPVGTIGEVFWFGEDQYKAARRSRYNRYNPYAGLVGKFIKDRYRVGIKWTENGVVKKEFASAENVEVINPDQHLQPESEFNYYPSGWRMLCL